MDRQEALEQAIACADSFGEVLPGYRFLPEFVEDFTTRYYFDFVFVTTSGQRPKEPPLAGGLAGLTVHKRTGETEALTFSELTMLREAENRMNDVYSRINEVKNGKGSLAWLKQRYALSSSQMYTLVKKIRDNEFNKLSVFEELEKLASKSRPQDGKR